MSVVSIRTRKVATGGPVVSSTGPATLADVGRAVAATSIVGSGEALLLDATHDSRQAGPGWLFCAMVGAVTDGHDHAADAVERGATGLLVQRPLDLGVPQVVVPDTRAATGPAASAVHGHPSRQMRVVGITGTNGKTTTSYLVEHAFAAAGIGTGVIGTIEARIHGERLEGVRTTPEGTDLQRLLRRMVDRGVEGVAMEASSHGLALHRVDGIDFDVAVHLNLTQDHLDFHPDMEDYFRAKARLFALAPVGVVCIEDDWGRRLADEVTIDVWTFGRAGRTGDRTPTWTIDELSVGPQGSTFVLASTDLRQQIHTRLLGDVNAVNAAAAWLAAVRAGVAPQVAADGIAACPGVPGRLEAVPNDHGLTVLVDYAHTPDAVEQVVRIARGIADEGARVVVVIGCGGDRDRAKRGPMGAAARSADLAVLTSDNPRSEDPEQILDAVEAGARSVDGGELVREVDRRQAIATAIGAASPGDVVVIAGKGHETGQAFADRTVPFDDRLVAADLLGAHR